MLAKIHSGFLSSLLQSV